MKRLLASVSLVVITTTAALAEPVAKPSAKPAPAPAKHEKAPPIRIAPADEYFGKLKLSILGIRNTIKDAGANLDIDQARWNTLQSKVAFAEDAIRDWEKKYPKDTWLAKTLFSLERMYAKLDSDDGRRHAIASMKWLVHDFPASWYGRTGKKELAQGKVGEPPVTTAANPSPAPVTSGVSGTADATAPVTLPASAQGGTSPATTSASGASPASPVPLPSNSPSLELQHP